MESPYPKKLIMENYSEKSKAIDRINKKILRAKEIIDSFSEEKSPPKKERYFFPPYLKNCRFHRPR